VPKNVKMSSNYFMVLKNAKMTKVKSQC